MCIRDSIMDGPPGLTIIIFSFLFMSLTVKLFFSKILINGGVVKYTTKNASMQEIIAGITNSINI